VISTMDEDLRDFLIEVLEGDGSGLVRDEFVVYIESDHGMRYGDWFRLIDGAMEHKLPTMMVLVADELLDRIPGSNSNLNHNSNRLISKFDWYVLDRYLSHVPYTTDPIPSLVNETMSSGFAVNPFLEKIPNTRTCSDINIPPYYCSCKAWADVDSVETVQVLAGEGILEINKLQRTPRFAFGQVC
jgi:hypothetical protein